MKHQNLDEIKSIQLNEKEVVNSAKVSELKTEKVEDDTKETAIVADSEISEYTPIRRRTRREFKNSGPLGNINVDKIKNQYKLYWAIVDENHGIGNLFDEGYAYVAPSEVDARENDGSPMNSSHVTRSAKGGKAFHVLLKKPIEWAKEDYETQVKENEAALFAVANEKSKDSNKDILSESSSLQLGKYTSHGV